MAEQSVHGLLYSQIGYDLRDVKRAVIRHTEKTYEAVHFQVLKHATLEPVLAEEAVYWGKKWGSHWWILDFTKVDTKGQYIIQAYDGQHLIYQSDIIEMDEWLLWNKTITDTVFTQFEARTRLARNHQGWKDCGSEIREVSSICGGLIGLADLLEKTSKLFNEEQIKFIVKQLIVGCDYLVLCQDKAASVGHPKGSVIHELPNEMRVIPCDQLQTSLCLSRASRLIFEHDRQKSETYLQRAEAAYQYFIHAGKPYGPDGFSRSNHGAPEDFEVPEKYMTRDLLLQLSAAYELYLCGKKSYDEDMFRIARKVMDRQIPKEASEDGLYGHFYTFGEAYRISEKSNVHHHVGHDTGAIYPHDLFPLIKLHTYFDRHEDAPRWKQCILDFAYGYFLPACEANPFKLLPVGYFEGQGLLWFCGPWHGINTTYAYAAALAMKLSWFTNDKRFREIAVSNLQWIAGLNAGITQKSFDACVIWKTHIPEGVAVPMSQIEGIGNRSVKAWSDIPGSICNGFSANIQFTFSTANTVENDTPMYYCDEDWVPHTGGWLCALSELFAHKRFD